MSTLSASCWCAPVRLPKIYTKRFCETCQPERAGVGRACDGAGGGLVAIALAANPENRVLGLVS